MASIHNEDLQSVLDEVKRLADHPYLNRIIGNPAIPVFFVRVLVRMLQSLGVPGERLRLYAAASALLKMGLDAHDRVSTERGPEETEKRRRQLFVLAGDYYSSLFYRMLSVRGEVEGIRRLSEAICVINERKTARHLEREQETPNENRIRLLGEIESGILAALADFFHVEKNSDTLWKAISLELMQLDALSRLEERGSPADKLGRFAEEAMNRMSLLLDKVKSPEIREELLQLASNRASLIRERIGAKGSEAK